MRFSPSWSGIEHKEIVVHVFVDLHNSSLICTSVAVVRCGEDRDNEFIMRPIEPVHDELMRTGYKLKVVHVVELLGNVLPERVPCTSRGDAPACAVIWV